MFLVPIQYGSRAIYSVVSLALGLQMVAAWVARPVVSDQLRELRLHGFLPMTGSGWPIGGACLPATLMAVRHVNERHGLLDAYNITYSWADTKVCIPSVHHFFS